jgi:general secretion pathway protein E
LTGHLVFSTLHTNDAASAVTRLLDLGIEPYLVASSLIAVVAQRLVRRVCADCRVPISDRNQLMRLNVDPGTSMEQQFYRGNGCETCRHTGYRGRVGVFELLAVDENIGRLIQTKANASDIRAAGVEKGMQLLRDDGLDKASRGLTSLDEVIRVAMRNAD